MNNIHKYSKPTTPSSLKQLQIDQQTCRYEELRMAVSGQFYYTDFKLKSKGHMFTVREDTPGNIIVVPYRRPNNNELLQLFIVFYLYNSKFIPSQLLYLKKYLYFEHIILPDNYPPTSTHWQTKYDFIRVFCAKIFTNISHLRKIEQLIEVFHDYEIFMEMLVVVFRSFLYQQTAMLDNDYNIPITHYHIQILNQRFKLQHYDIYFQPQQLTTNPIDHIFGLSFHRSNQNKPNIIRQNLKINKTTSIKEVSNPTHIVQNSINHPTTPIKSQTTSKKFQRNSQNTDSQKERSQTKKFQRKSTSKSREKSLTFIKYKTYRKQQNNRSKQDIPQTTQKYIKNIRDIINVKARILNEETTIKNISKKLAI